MRLAALALAAAVLAPGWALAQPRCPATSDAALPDELAPWTAKAALTTAAKPADLAQAELKIGQAATAALHPTPQMSFPAMPGNRSAPDNFGGLIDLTIAEPGTYRLALGSGAWVDVLDGSKPLMSDAFGPGPSCSTIRKTVFFVLKPGRYTIEISEAPEATMAIMAVKSTR